MKNKFLVSLLFGTALCAGFGDVAFGAETEAQTQANNLIKKYGVAKFIKDGDFGQQAIQEVALALINDDRVSRGDKEKLQAKLPLASSSIPVRSIPVASTTSDASAGGGSTNSIPPATNPKFSWSTYKNAQKPRWQAEALNEATLSERKFVTSFLKHASRAAILDVLNHIPAERKLALADIIGQTTFEAPTNSIHELSVDEASASHSHTPPASSRRSASLEESFGGGAPARAPSSRTTARLSENEAAIAYVEQKFSSRAAEKVRETLEQGDEEAIRVILNKYGYTSKESRDSRSDDSLSSYTSAPSSLLAPTAKTSVTTTGYDDALDYIGRTYSEAARNKAKAVIDRGNSEEIEAILRKYNVPR